MVAGLYPVPAVLELFSLFDRDGDGFLSQQEYHAFCQATEAGAGCDDARW